MELIELNTGLVHWRVIGIISGITPAPSALGQIGHMTHTAIAEPAPTGYLLAA